MCLSVYLVSDEEAFFFLLHVKLVSDPSQSAARSSHSQICIWCFTTTHVHYLIWPVNQWISYNNNTRLIDLMNLSFLTYRIFWNGIDCLLLPVVHQSNFLCQYSISEAYIVNSYVRYCKDVLLKYFPLCEQMNRKICLVAIYIVLYVVGIDARRQFSFQS